LGSEGSKFLAPTERKCKCHTYQTLGTHFQKSKLNAVVIFHDAKLQFEILVLYTKSALIFNRKLPIYSMLAYCVVTSMLRVTAVRFCM